MPLSRETFRYSTRSSLQQRTPRNQVLAYEMRDPRRSAAKGLQQTWDSPGLGLLGPPAPRSSFPPHLAEGTKKKDVSITRLRIHYRKPNPGHHHHGTGGDHRKKTVYVLRVIHRGGCASSVDAEAAAAAGLLATRREPRRKGRPDASFANGLAEAKIRWGGGSLRHGASGCCRRQALISSFKSTASAERRVRWLRSGIRLSPEVARAGVGETQRERKPRPAQYSAAAAAAEPTKSHQGVTRCPGNRVADGTLPTLTQDG
ncbi:hypothetical protein HPB50_019275 [Hyalomma asiaticum]|uniref:Uncharacterized protein n=1 Tax=Hyalomma asiaticum TaxID=266040 RepID=A0ACB7RXH6_HYAAI|nr:hypothetical protein HPB50_019275 [Hyalomma asiaticum]